MEDNFIMPALIYCALGFNNSRQEAVFRFCLPAYRQSKGRFIDEFNSNTTAKLYECYTSGYDIICLTISGRRIKVITNSVEKFVMLYRKSNQIISTRFP